MLAKKYKLTTKDINFLYKKQKFIAGKMFLFLVYPQYPNRLYNQFSINIPVKFSKKSTLRNKIKRILYDYLRKNKYFSYRFCWKFWKIFIFLNKKNIDNFEKIINKKENKLLEEMFSKELKVLEKKICLHK